MQCQSFQSTSLNRHAGLLTLAQLALTSAVHTASCERGFSVQNNILTPLRNHLTVDIQHKLIRVKIGPGEPNSI